MVQESTTPKRRLLYIEDDEGLAILFRNHMRRANYAVDLAHTGADGEKLYLEGAYDIAILDYRLPDTYGFLLLKTLVDHPVATPVILLTALGDERAAVEAMQIGAVDYIVKDAEHTYLQLLPSVIEAAVNRAELQRRNSEQQVQLKNTNAELEKLASDLSEREQFNRSILDNSPDCIKVIDREGRIQSINQNGLKQLEIEDAGVCINAPWAGMLPPEAATAVHAAMASAHKGEASRFEMFAPTFKNTPKWWEMYVTPIFSENREVTKILAISRDISERRQFEEQLREALRKAEEERTRAEEANSAKTDFLANMSHEIRTPMNAVVGIANILARTSPLTEKQKEFITTLQVSAESLMALLDDLLDVAKIESRNIEFENVDFEIKQVIQDVISVMAVRAKEKNIEFTVVDSGLPDRRHIGDPARLRQVLMNLCSNAIKFTEKGSVKVLLDGHALPDQNADAVVIRVIDTGIGIAPENQDKVFQKFMQADSSISRKFGGTGLGLAITRALTEAMGGQITLTSTLGAGSTFQINLTLPRADIEKAAIEAEEFHPALHKGERPKVLLVEDYAPNTLVAGVFLEDFGYHYDVASNGLEAFDKIKSGDYAAVLMDIQMPNLNGYDATMKIRDFEKEHGRKPVPIIGMTAHALAQDERRCLECGMNDYISKPFNPSDLREKLSKATRAAA